MHNEWIIDTLGTFTIYKITLLNRKKIKHHTFLSGPKILAVLIKLNSWEKKKKKGREKQELYFMYINCTSENLHASEIIRCP